MEHLALNPKIRESLKLRDKAMTGDLVFVVDPATLASDPITGAWTRTVVITLETADGQIHDWFTKSITSGCSIADTSTAGTATIPSTTLSFVNGLATKIITGSAHAWLDTETDTFTVAQATILGYTVASKTSVETFTA